MPSKSPGLGLWAEAAGQSWGRNGALGVHCTAVQPKVQRSTPAGLPKSAGQTVESVTGLASMSSLKLFDVVVCQGSR